MSHEPRRIVKVYPEFGKTVIVHGAIQGPKGDPGISIQGPPGPPGPSTIPGFYQGSGPPTEDTLQGAAVGSSYLDIQTFMLYRKD